MSGAGNGAAPSVAALVTDVHIRSAVAGMRGLGGAGVRVTAVGPSKMAAGLWSRHASARIVAPDVTSDAPGFVAAVAEAARRHGPLVVYPGWEGALEAVLAARDRLGDVALVPYPPNAVVESLRDKRRLGGLAEDAGLRSPAALFSASAAELRSAAVRLPCVVKPVRSGGALLTATVVGSAEALHALLAPLPDDEPLLVQEQARGTLAALTMVLARDGSLVARFQQAARRTWPGEAGPTAVGVSVAPDEPLVERAAAMLAGAGYWGLAQLQFIETPNGPLLIDANPRFYGSLPLALAAGVNLPAAWHAVTVGGPLPVPAPYRVGLGYRWLEADLAAAARGSVAPLLSLRPRPGTGAMWAGDDPLASAALALDALGSRVTRRLPGRREHGR